MDLNKENIMKLEYTWANMDTVTWAPAKMVLSFISAKNEYLLFLFWKVFQ